jgi:hypothetical protein
MFKRTVLVALTMGPMLLLTAVPADAQIGRIRDRVQREVERRTEQAVDRAVDRAVDSALGSAERKLEDRLFGPPNERGAGGAVIGGLNIDALQAGFGLTVAGASADPVDFRDLRALLPESAAGIPRTDIQGQRNSAFGFSTSEALASYDQDARSVRITITDSGTMSAMMAYGYGWAAMEIDRETEAGFERTITHRGHPGFLNVDRAGGDVSSSLNVLVVQRFIVNLEGHGVDEQALLRAAESIDISRLEAMKDFGVKEAAALTDFRALGELLPASLPGMERQEVTGESSTTLGISASFARVAFRGADGQSCSVTITDLGSMRNLTHAAMTMASIDRESDRGYERTTTWESWPATERLDRYEGSVHSNLQVMVEKRFMVQVEGNVEMDVAKAALRQIDLARLKTMAE